jgi:CheY-like chemotaxis protein
VDDAKAPERAFTVKCPKCQTPVKFAGKAAAAAPAAPGEAQEMRAGMMAQLRREMGIAPGGGDASMRALIALPDPAQTAALSQTLSRLGYAVDTLDEGGEAIRLVEQGVYGVIVTSKAAGAAGKETLLQRVGRLNPEGRRRIFLALVGDEFKTGDGTQAFAAMADLVLSGRDVAGADAALRNTMAERTRLYQMFTDARRRFEASAG